MVREEPVVSLLRFYDNDTDDPYAKYSAQCTLLWESPTVVWVKGLTGKFSRQALRDFAHYIESKGIKIVRAYRSSGILPFATKINEHYCEIDVELAKPKAAKFLA